MEAPDRELPLISKRNGRRVILTLSVALMLATALSWAGIVSALTYVWVNNPGPRTVDAHWSQYDTHADLKAGGFIAYIYRWCWNVVGQPQNCDNKADVYAIYFPRIDGMQCTWVQPDFYLYTITGLTPETSYEFRLFAFTAKFIQEASCQPPKLVLPPDIRGGDTNYCLVPSLCTATTLPGGPPPPPRGGSPRVTLYGAGCDWIKETNVLPQSESYVGPSPPDWDDTMQFQAVANGTGGFYRTEIHEFQTAYNFFDRIALKVVDYPLGYNVAVGPDGQVHSYSETVSPVSAVNSVGQSIFTQVASQDGEFYTAAAPTGDYVTVDFGPLSALPGQYQKLTIKSRDNVPSACNCYKWGIPIQVQALNGSWTTRSTLYPRLSNQVQIVDLTGQFAPNGNARIRLLLVGEHEIDWLSMEAHADSTMTPTTVLPSQVNYSSGASAALDMIQSDDGSYLTLNPGEFLFVAFPAPSQTGAQRTLFLQVNGYYLGAQGGGGMSANR